MRDSASSLPLPPAELRAGAEHWNRGAFFQAHEAWEEPWRRRGRASPAGRFLQGLILLAAAGVKHERGALAVARRLAARGAERLRDARVAAGFDPPAFAAEVERWLAGGRPNAPKLTLGPP